jgi:LysM repeat protein
MTIKDTIESYRKRRNQPMPLILGGVAILLVVVGVIIVVTSLNGGGVAKLFATKTPTPTITPTPTNTLLPTDTPTSTLTPTITPTATPSDVWTYTVQEGDNLTTIIKNNNLGDNALINIIILNSTPGNLFNPDSIQIGQKITLPPPNWPLITPTPLPTGLGPGSRIDYLVLPGESLGSIANKFNSTVDAIVLANQAALQDGAKSLIYPGQLLIVPINLVTPVPTKPATATPTPTVTATP